MSPGVDRAQRRRDVLIVASVSCIYGLGSPDEYKNMHLFLRRDEEYAMEKVRQRPALKANSGSLFCDSGLLHQLQDRGQPFRNTMVRIPGQDPSGTDGHHEGLSAL